MAGGSGLPARDNKSQSENTSERDERSGDEHVVFGDEKSEVRIDVADDRLTTCFLNRFSGGVIVSTIDVMCDCEGVDKGVVSVKDTWCKAISTLP
jgi:hypothetical protein